MIRTGSLRYDTTDSLGMNARVTGSTARISAVDAQVVAMAEERSTYNAVTIPTSDPDDIQLLVDLTGAPSISVRSV